MYIINTDQGYIGKGSKLHNGLHFTEKEESQTFTETELNNFKIDDLYVYYCCESVEIEALN